MKQTKTMNPVIRAFIEFIIAESVCTGGEPSLNMRLLFGDYKETPPTAYTPPLINPTAAQAVLSEGTPSRGLEGSDPFIR